MKLHVRLELACKWRMKKAAWDSITKPRRAWKPSKQQTRAPYLAAVLTLSYHPYKPGFFSSTIDVLQNHSGTKPEVAEVCTV